MPLALTHCSRQILPLKKVRITRPPVPFLKSDDIHQFQAKRKQLRCQAHQIKSEDIRKKFRDVRNLVRAGEEINYQKALSSKSPKYYSARFTESSTPIQTPFVQERWWVEQTSYQHNSKRILGSKESDSFVLREVAFKEIEQQIIKKGSELIATRPDLIPANSIKLVSEYTYITSPLTDRINRCIEKNTFPKALQTSRYARYLKLTIQGDIMIIDQLLSYPCSPKCTNAHTSTDTAYLMTRSLATEKVI